MRTSRVKELQTVNLSLASTLQIGDVKYVDGLTDVIAVQTARTVYGNDPKSFGDYEIFKFRPVFPILNESLSFVKNDVIPAIKVNCLHLTSVANSAVVAVGNIGHIRMQARILNIRDYTINERNED